MKTRELTVLAFFAEKKEKLIKAIVQALGMATTTIYPAIE